MRMRNINKYFVFISTGNEFGNYKVCGMIFCFCFNVK